MRKRSSSSLSCFFLKSFSPSYNSFSSSSSSTIFSFPLDPEVALPFWSLVFSFDFCSVSPTGSPEFYLGFSLISPYFGRASHSETPSNLLSIVKTGMSLSTRCCRTETVSNESWVSTRICRYWIISETQPLTTVFSDSKSSKCLFAYCSLTERSLAFSVFWANLSIRLFSAARSDWSFSVLESLATSSSYLSTLILERTRESDSFSIYNGEPIPAMTLLTASLFSSEDLQKSAMNFVTSACSFSTFSVASEMVV